MRAIFIFAGVALIERFDWVLYVFGAFLLFTAGRMLFSDNEHVDPGKSRFLKLVNRVIPSTDKLDGPQLFTRINGKRLATPLFAVLLLVEATDVIFAVDSVPAVLAVSHEQFIVFSSNAFAILGLRALYFLLADMHARFSYLQQGLAIILAFVGVKMIIAEWYHIPTWLSLLVIAIVLTVVDRRSRCKSTSPASTSRARAGLGQRSPPRPTASTCRRRDELLIAASALMAIVDDDIERLRSTVSIVDVVGQFVTLRKVGRNWVGLCPFHAERTPSFNVREETGRYQCFGCDQSGDVFTFVQEHEHVDFVGAVEYLAAKAGIQLTYTSTGQSRERARRKRLVEAMATAVEWYHERLLDDPAARPARDYLRSRGCRRRRPPVQARLGARRLGRAGHGSRASTASCCATTGWRSPTGATACRTRSGPACCSRSSPRAARRWRSAAGSCPARPTRRSTRTRRRRRSTPSRRRCTG